MMAARLAATQHSVLAQRKRDGGSMKNDLTAMALDHCIFLTLDRLCG
jgi:hypothetical protein